MISVILPKISLIVEGSLVLGSRSRDGVAIGGGVGDRLGTRPFPLHWCLPSVGADEV